MNYDPGTVAMLRAVLDETLLSRAFTAQSQIAAVDVAQYVLHLASKGERDPHRIKTHIQNLLTVKAAA